MQVWWCTSRAAAHHCMLCMSGNAAVSAPDHPTQAMQCRLMVMPGTSCTCEHPDAVPQHYLSSCQAHAAMPGCPARSTSHDIVMLQPHLKHHAHDDNIIHSCVLQKVHLQETCTLSAHHFCALIEQQPSCWLLLAPGAALCWCQPPSSTWHLPTACMLLGDSLDPEESH